MSPTTTESGINLALNRILRTPEPEQLAVRPQLIPAPRWRRLGEQRRGLPPPPPSEEPPPEEPSEKPVLRIYRHPRAVSDIRTAPFELPKPKTINEGELEITPQGTSLPSGLQFTLPRPKAPILTTPKGKKIVYPMSDNEWASMTAAEKVYYEAKPQQWLEQRDDWIKQRQQESTIKFIANQLGIPNSMDTPANQLSLAINGALWLVPVPAGKIVKVGYGAMKRTLPEGAKAAIAPLEETLTRIAKIDIGEAISKSGGKVTQEMAANAKRTALDALSGERGGLKMPAGAPSEPTKAELIAKRDALIASIPKSQEQQIMSPDIKLARDEIARLDAQIRAIPEATTKTGEGMVTPTQPSPVPIATGGGGGLRPPLTTPPPEIKPSVAAKPSEDEILNVFGKRIASPKTAKETLAQKELWATERVKRSTRFSELLAQEQAKGTNAEESIRNATNAFKGEFPRVSTGLDLPPEFRDVAYAKVIRVIQADTAIPESMKAYEIAGTKTALDNALKGNPIPDIPGTKGGSAKSRLLKIFNDNPVIKEIIDNPDAVQKRLLENALPPEDLDPAVMRYLRNLPTAPFGVARLGELYLPPKPIAVVKETYRGQRLQEFLIDIAKAPSTETMTPAQAVMRFEQFTMLPPTQREVILSTLKTIDVNAIDAFGIPKSLKFGYDVSMPLRQGVILGVRHPVSWAKMWKPMVQALKSEEVALKLNREILADPETAQAIQKMGLDLYGVEKGLGYMARPESMASLMAEKYIPGVRPSARAAAVAMNKLMTDVGVKNYRILQKMGASEEEYSAMGELINQLAGRGTLPKWAQGNVGDVLNKLLTSPRYLVSRFEWPTKLLDPSKAVRQEAASTLVAWSGLMGTIVGLAYAGGARVELDPRSSDAYKIRIGGKRIDVWVGYAQIIRFLAQMITGQIKTRTGEIISIPRSQVLARYAQSKESPGIGALVTLLSGENYVGEKLDLKTLQGIGNFFKETFAPAALEEMVDAYAEEGALSALLSGAGLGGVSVSTYGGQKEREATIAGILANFGKIDQTGLDTALKQATKDKASPARIAEIKAKDWTYDITSLRRDIGVAIQNVSDEDKTKLNPIAVDYAEFFKQKDAYGDLSNKEQEAYLKNNPDFVANRIFWGELTEIPDLATAEAVTAKAQAQNIPLNMIPAFQLNDKGKERIPSNRELWKPYFDYYALPGNGGYLSYTKAQVDAGKLPVKYLAEWQAFQKLKTDTGRTLYREYHEAASTNRREAFRRQNKEIDKWLQENEGLKPLSKVSLGGSGIKLEIYGRPKIESRMK